MNLPRAPQWKWDINLGSLLAALSMIGTLIYTTGQTTQRIDNMEAGITARRVYADQKFKTLDETANKAEQNARDIVELKVSDRKTGETLDKGREERISSQRDQDRQISDLRRDLAVMQRDNARMAEDIARVRQIVEAVGRKPDIPFGGGENQMWTPPLIDPNLRPPVILKATVNRSRVAARRGVKRRTVVAVSLTRSLERAFGRPHFRGRYWASLAGR